MQLRLKTSVSESYNLNLQNLGKSSNRTPQKGSFFHHFRKSKHLCRREIDFGSHLIANEVVEDYKCNGKKGWWMKLDIEKAFDRVDWNFLEEVLFQIGFGKRWISWINGCIRGTKYSIFNNGRPKERIIASRGLRQGATLSPFLFIMVSGILSNLLESFSKGFEHRSIRRFTIRYLVTKTSWQRISSENENSRNGHKLKRGQVIKD